MVQLGWQDQRNNVLNLGQTVSAPGTGYIPTQASGAGNVAPIGNTPAAIDATTEKNRVAAANVPKTQGERNVATDKRNDNLISLIGAYYGGEAAGKVLPVVADYVIPAIQKAIPYFQKLGGTAWTNFTKILGVAKDDPKLLTTFADKLGSKGVFKDGKLLPFNPDEFSSAENSADAFIKSWSKQHPSPKYSSSDYPSGFTAKKVPEQDLNTMAHNDPAQFQKLNETINPAYERGYGPKSIVVDPKTGIHNVPGTTIQWTPTNVPKSTIKGIDEFGNNVSYRSTDGITPDGMNFFLNKHPGDGYALDYGF